MLGWQLFNRGAQIFWYPNNHTSIVWLVQHDPSTLHEVWRHAHYIKLQLILQKFRLERYCGFLLKFWISCCTVLCVLPWYSMNICCLCRLRWIHKSVCNSRRCTATVDKMSLLDWKLLSATWSICILRPCVNIMGTSTLMVFDYNSILQGIWILSIARRLGKLYINYVWMEMRDSRSVMNWRGLS